MHMKHITSFPAFALVGLLAGCALSPRPFQAASSHVAAPPVLFVSADKAAGQGSATYARDLAAALATYGVPTTTDQPKDRNWQLRIMTAQAGAQVTPTYQIIGPDKKIYDQLPGSSIPVKGWTTDDPAVLSQAAAQDASNLSNLLAKLNAKIQLEAPDSLANRPPRLFIGTVTGAPGDGDSTFPADLGHDLSMSGLKLVTDKNAADFSVTGQVKTIPATKADSVIELNWVVHDSNGRLVGQVTQLREVKAADPTAWSAIAPSVVQEAANGVATVVHNDIVKHHAAQKD